MKHRSDNDTEPHNSNYNNGQPLLPIAEFGMVNWCGLYTLTQREIKRFTSIWRQTLLAPVITGGLFLFIFTIAIGTERKDVMGVTFTHFLVPGIITMTVIQNAFANTSSSILIAKIQRNIIDTLMPPLSALELTIGHIIGGTARGIAVSFALALPSILILDIIPVHILWILVFIFLGSTMMAAVGIIVGILANKFDQMATITNFIITPLAFLSGTFYSKDALPPALQVVTDFNPIFYLIDGVRYGFIGQSNSDPLLSLVICIGIACALTVLCWYWFYKGYRIKP